MADANKRPSYWQRQLKALARAGVAVMVAVLIATPFSAHNFLRPPRTEAWRTPVELGLPYEDVRFQGDRVELAGWFISGRTGRAIVLVHGIPSNRSELLDVAAMLHGEGYSVLLWDLRAQGASGGETSTYGYREADDLLAAIEYTKGRRDVDPKRVGVLGVSFGAATALLAAARSPDINGVVADSSFATLQDKLNFYRGSLGPFGPVHALVQALAEWQEGFSASQVQPIQHIASISPRPVLFIHGGADQIIPTQDSVRLYQAAKDPRELWVVPGAEHAQARLVAPQEYRRKVTALFAAAFVSVPAASR